MILAGDVGGTKVFVGLFEPDVPRPRPLNVRSFATGAFADLPSMLTAFLDGAGRTGATIESACFGVAGPIVGDSAKLTNGDWVVNARSVADALDCRRVRLLNDLEAMAYGVPMLNASEVHALQNGTPSPAGNIAVIAAGTGLGEALLVHVDGRLVASPSEAGNADFAARTEREIALFRDLLARHGRVAVEHVVSGPGLVNIHRLTHGAQSCAAGIDPADAEAPAAISRAALDQRCTGCREALDVFVGAYGAEAGNLALRTVATGGVYVGGGIAVRILPALAAGGFMSAFRAKAPFERMLGQVPVRVILNPEVGLLGAAGIASRASER